MVMQLRNVAGRNVYKKNPVTINPVVLTPKEATFSSHLHRKKCDKLGSTYTNPTSLCTGYTYFFFVALVKKENQETRLIAESHFAICPT